VRYDQPQLRDKLAAEYVLGTMTGRVRARCQRLLRYDAALRRDVAAWETRLAPLADLTSAVNPPARVWRAITARIGSAQETCCRAACARLGRRISASCAGLRSLFTSPGRELSTVAVLANESRSQWQVSLPAKTSARSSIQNKNAG
jgi:anti-sigma-K factor RskA